MSENNSNNTDDKGPNFEITINKASVTILHPLNKIQNFINRGDIGVALLLLSVRVESELSERIKSHFEINESQFEGLDLDSNTIGWYLSKANSCDLVDSEYRSTLEKLKNERNALVHDKGHFETIEASQPRKEEIKNILRDTISFLE